LRGSECIDEESENIGIDLAIRSACTQLVPLEIEDQSPMLM